MEEEERDGEAEKMGREGGKGKGKGNFLFFNGR